MNSRRGANAANQEPPPSGLAVYLIEGIYAFILVVTIATWTLVGFAVWVPLLVRTTSILAASVFYASLFRDQARVTGAQRAVHFAVHFYLRGYSHFVTFYQQRHEPEQPMGLLEPLSDLKWKELVVQCLWVIVVWVGGFVLVHGI